MPELAKRPRFRIGDKIRFHFAGKSLVGMISEARGTYNPAGHVHYTVHVPMDPEPLWLPIREGQVEEVLSSFADGS